MPEVTTGSGADLAATVDGGGQVLHAVVENLEDGWDSGDGGAHDASVYLRTTDAGRTWEKRLLIGGIVLQMAAAGRHVFVAFLAYECKDGIGVLRNRDHGLRGAWSAVRCLTRREGWPPSIAATGRLVYVASADPSTGDVVMHISRDLGDTWTSVSLGSAHDEEDEWVDVEVAAEGSFVAVAWSNDGVVFARASVDAGRHWDDATRLADGRVMSASAGEARVAFSGSGIERSSWVRTRTETGDWIAVDVPSDASYSAADPWGVGVVLGPNTSLAIAYDACHANEAGVDEETSWWVASRDEGVHWGAPERIAGCIDPVSPLWTSDDHAFIVAWKDAEEGHVLAARP